MVLAGYVAQLSQSLKKTGRPSRHRSLCPYDGQLLHPRQLSASSPGLGRMAAYQKGFGCRPVVTYLRALRAGVRKPPRKEPGGRQVGG